MIIEKLYILFICLFVVAGFALTRQAFRPKQYIRFQVRPDHWLQNVMFILKDKNFDEVFLASGINLSIAKYTAIRNLIAICAIALLCIQLAAQGIDAIKVPLCVVIILYIVSYPAQTFGKGKSATPFKWVLDKCKESKLVAKDNELMKITAQLKNLLLTQESSWSADYIMEVLMRYTKVTKPVFAQTLSYMRLGDMDQAYLYFKDHIGTKLGISFAEILLKLNVLEPVEFLKQVEALQSALKEEKRTRRIKKQDVTAKKCFSLLPYLSLLYFLITCTLFLRIYLNKWQ